MKPFVPRPEPPLFAALATVALLLPAVGASAQEPPAARSSPLFAAAAAPTPAAASTMPAPEAPAAPESSETEIVATQGADFDSRGRIASFNGAVHVADPRFELWCDKLTVYLNKAAEKKGETPPPVLPTAAPAGEKKEGEAGGIDRAVAEGHVVIIQHKAMDKSGKPLPETGTGAPKTSIGRAERAEFKNKTGEMTLSGSPRVQQDINEHVGAPGTTMVLGRDSTLKTFGASRTVIRQKPDVDGAKKDKPPADAGTPPRRRG